MMRWSITEGRGASGGIAGLLLAVALAAASLAPATIGRTGAIFSASDSSTATLVSAGACASGTPYVSYLSSLTPAPILWWRIAETGVPATIADFSGNANNGKVSGTGLTFGLANAGLISCETTYGLRQAGAAASTGAISWPAAIARPSTATFTLVTWIRENTARGGRLLGFGNTSSGASTTADRALVLTTAGRVAFHMKTSLGANVLLTSPAVVNNNVVHMIAATFSGGVMRLYVDGVKVGTGASITPLAYNGFWRAGYDNLAGIGPSTRNQAATTQDEITVWEGTALTDMAIANLYSANHW